MGSALEVLEGHHFCQGCGDVFPPEADGEPFLGDDWYCRDCFGRLVESWTRDYFPEPQPQ